jgi:hypothetical protein
MCTGCVQSGLEFAAAGSVVLAAGLRQAGARARDRLRPADATDRRARREADAARFLEGLDLDPATLLGGELTVTAPAEATVEAAVEAAVETANEAAGATEADAEVASQELQPA